MRWTAETRVPAAGSMYAFRMACPGPIQGWGYVAVDECHSLGFGCEQVAGDVRRFGLRGVNQWLPGKMSQPGFMVSETGSPGKMSQPGFTVQEIRWLGRMSPVGLWMVSR